ncbi:tetratricopeptide repeat protein, partial [Saccharopolyspora rectivirgula]|uniref:tetratricopeptide repeat protein n=1 Tax=Saccharopolyspora rectivirgula TaxID=28042 RepID=UPI00191C20DA
METAGWTADLAIALAQQGRVEEALKASTETVGIRRELAEARPDAFRPDLAASLTNQASFLAGLGRVEEALKASTEAVGFYRELAEARPDAFRL